MKFIVESHCGLRSINILDGRVVLPTKACGHGVQLMEPFQFMVVGGAHPVYGATSLLRVQVNSSFNISETHTAGSCSAGSSIKHAPPPRRIDFSSSNSSSKQRKACGECGSFEHTVLCCSSIVFNFKLLILLLQILDR